jgi:hypothetical protein
MPVSTLVPRRVEGTTAPAPRRHHQRASLAAATLGFLVVALDAHVVNVALRPARQLPDHGGPAVHYCRGQHSHPTDHPLTLTARTAKEHPHASSTDHEPDLEQRD